MNKLTVTQLSFAVGKSAYTIKRWYNWYEQLTTEEIEMYKKQGMPELPKYETVGPTKWRYWNEEDVKQIKKFSKWVPNTRAGVMGSLNKKGE